MSKLFKLMNPRSPVKVAVITEQPGKVWLNYMLAVGGLAGSQSFATRLDAQTWFHQEVIGKRDGIANIWKEWNA